MRNFLLILILFPILISAQPNLVKTEVKPKDPRYTELIERAKSLALIGGTRKITEAKVGESKQYAWFLNQFSQGGNQILNSYILSEEHGGYLENIRFEEEGANNKLVAYLDDACLVEDADSDGEPEFYLTYSVDRTAEQGHKTIHLYIFTKLNGETDFSIGEIQAVYQNKTSGALKIQEGDSTFLGMSKEIQKKAEQILKGIKAND